MNQGLRVNPIECTAHGMCAELIPERVTLDDWGFPIIDASPVGEDLIDHARRAVAACPTFALKLERLTTPRVRDATAQTS
jgi:ferredoxin